MKEAMKTAEVLVEALPYIRRFYGKTVVIKYGGHAMVDEEIKNKVISDIVLMKYIGINPVIIHGGGPDINYWLKKNHQESTFIGGLRVTDKATMEIAQMVLVGKVNQEIVGLLQKNGGKAVGISGIDGNTVVVKKKFWEENGECIDLGYVGEVSKVNTELIDNAMNNGFIPVIAPVGCDENGEVYNINGDYAAGSIAAQLKADKLFMLTDINGVLDKGGEIISTLRFADAKQKISDGTICGGMIPKVECCMSAIEKGVQSVHIVNGCLPHSMLLELFTNSGVGTMVIKE